MTEYEAIIEAQQFYGPTGYADIRYEGRTGRQKYLVGVILSSTRFRVFGWGFTWDEAFEQAILCRIRQQAKRNYPTARTPFQW